jgi:hypothetical protein
MPDQNTTQSSSSQTQAQDQTGIPTPVVTDQSLHDPLPLVTDPVFSPADSSPLSNPDTILIPGESPTSPNTDFSLGDLPGQAPANPSEPIISPDTPITAETLHIPETTESPQISDPLIQSPFSDATFVSGEENSTVPAPTLQEPQPPETSIMPEQVSVEPVAQIPTVSETPTVQIPTTDGDMIITDMFYELGDTLKDVFDLMNKNIKEDTITLQREDETKNPQMYMFQIVDGGNGIIITKQGENGQSQVLKYMYNILDYKLDVFLNEQMIYEEFDGNTHVFKLKDLVHAKTIKFKTLAENQLNRLQEEKKKADEEAQNSQLESELTAF